MPQDNTLGAPTEGLGQTVTFAADSRQGVPQTSAIQRGTMRNNASGGGAVRTAQALQVQAPKGDTLFQTLARLGGDILKPQLEAERTLKFAEGMQQAAAGQAISEIVDEQPWYSKLFGSTSVVDGARAYTASTKATLAAAELEKDMHNLRKLSPKEMAAKGAEIMTREANTGDSITDAMVTQQLAQTLPNVMRAQAKAHLHYQQEQLVEGVGSNFTAAAELMRAVGNNVAEGKTAEDTDGVGAQLAFLSVLTPPPDMAPDLFYHTVADRAAAQIGQGNFAVYDTMKDSGFMDKLTSQQQHALRSARYQASNEARANLPIEFLKEQAAWQRLANDPNSDQAAIPAGAAALNAEYTRLTGDRQPAISPAATVRELEQWAAVQEAERKRVLREAEQAAKPSEKFALEQQALGIQVAAVQAGQSMRDFSDKEQKQTWQALHAVYANNPAALQKIRSEQMREDIYDTEWRDAMRRAVNTAVQGGDAMGLEQAYHKYWMPLVKDAGDRGLSVALAYAGKEVGSTLALYHQMAQGTPASENTIKARYNRAVLPQPAEVPMGKGSKGAADLKVLESGMIESSWFAIGRVFNEDDYPIENPEAVLGWITPNIPKGVEDAKERVEAGKRNTPNLSVIGGYGWIRGTRETDVKQYLLKMPKDTEHAPTKENYNTVVREHVDMLKNFFDLGGTISVWQSQDDPGGVPRLAISGEGPKGEALTYTFTAQEAAASYAKRRATKPFVMGAKITNVPAEGAPSIYAGEEAWKAYRQRQAAKQN